MYFLEHEKRAYSQFIASRLCNRHITKRNITVRMINGIYYPAIDLITANDSYLYTFSDGYKNRRAALTILYNFLAYDHDSGQTIQPIGDIIDKDASRGPLAKT